jgi:hypothetical protein
MRVIVTAYVEAGGPEEAADAFTPLLEDLGVPVAERWEPVVYDRAPGTYMASAVLADLADDEGGDREEGRGRPPEGPDARETAVRLAERMRLTGWQVEGDADDAEVVWNGDAQPGEAAPYPGVTWALIEVDPKRGDGDDVPDGPGDASGERSLEGEALLWTLVITMDEQWWRSTATAVVVVKVAAEDAVEARRIAQETVAPLRAAVHEEPRPLGDGEWRVVFKAFAEAAADGAAEVPGAVETAGRFAELVRPSGWTIGGGDCGYAVWGRGDAAHDTAGEAGNDTGNGAGNDAGDDTAPGTAAGAAADPVREIFIAVP